MRRPLAAPCIDFLREEHSGLLAIDEACTPSSLRCRRRPYFNPFAGAESHPSFEGSSHAAAKASKNSIDLFAYVRDTFFDARVSGIKI